jgi:hypothetical protein
LVSFDQAGRPVGSLRPGGAPVGPYAQFPDHGGSSGAARCIVKMPRPLREDGTTFVGGIPKRSATFGWAELCATPDPEASLAPSPQVAQKTWCNSYMYFPARHSHTERQFLERFVQGPNGEWLDVVKARRMAEFYEEQRLKTMKEQMERELIMSGSVTQNTHFTDAYSGERLVACGGELLPKQQLLDEFEIHDRRYEIKNQLQDAKAEFDFDNLRVPWPFGRPHRNKRISQHTYDWFDRSNPYISCDRDVEIIETASTYVDREHHERWGSGQRMYTEGPAAVQRLDL